MAVSTPVYGNDDAPEPYKNLTLDPSLYEPTPEAVDFFKKVTGISDDDELKQHVLAVQKEAWEVRSQVCPV